MKRILCICCFFTDSNTVKANIRLIAVAQYREAAAFIIAKDLAENIQERDFKVKRTAVLDRTNLQLRSMKLPSVSYGFIRKFL